MEILRGDPRQVAALADALAFEHKYTSGVIAWAPNDTPTDAQIGAVIEALGRQVAQFGGQVTYLAQDYRTLAETLRGRWN